MATYAATYLLLSDDAQRKSAARDAHRWAEVTARFLRFPEAICQRVSLVAGEATTNSIEHTKASVVRLEVEDHPVLGLLLTVKDNGHDEPDLHHVLDSQVASPAPWEAERGRGLTVMSKLADTLSFRRVSGVTYVHAGFRRPAA